MLFLKNKKAIEPLFILIGSYYINKESHETILYFTLVPICLGIILIINAQIELNSIGFFLTFAANISTASRSVFYKSKLNESQNVSSKSFSTFLNVGCVSFVIYFPLYLIRLLVKYFHDDENFKLIQSGEIFIYLLLGSFFNFAYNLFSFNVLTKISPISHSIINIVKRAFIVFGSMIVFATQVTSVQMIGMLMTELGVFMYSIVKCRSKVIIVKISEKTRTIFKHSLILMNILLVLSGNFNRMSNKSKRTELIQLDYGSSGDGNYNDSNRIVCINKIKSEIIDSFEPLLPKNKTYHFLELPFRRNYGDTLIW